MVSRTLGDSGLVVSRLGLGLAALGRPGYVNLGHGTDLGDETAVEDLALRTHAVLDAARAGGIVYLDVARSYGRAEQFLAGWLASRGIGGDDVTIGTKWGYTYTAGWRVSASQHEVKDHGLATLRRQWAETQAVLPGAVDLLQVHSATLDSGILDDVAVHEELARIRASGEVRAIGLSLSGSEQEETLRRAREIETDGRRLIDVVQATWNALEPSTGAALAAANAAGVGIIVKEALANGRLVRGREARAVEVQAQRLGTSPDAIALAHAVSQPWADVVLSGAVSVDQLRTNERALDIALDEEARSAMEALAMPVEAYWRERGAMTWN